MVLLTLGLAACDRDTAQLRVQHLADGDRLRSEGRLDAAIAAYRQALRLDGTAVEVRQALAETYLAAGDRARALEEFVRIADLRPESDEAQLRAGRALVVAGRFDDATARAERVLARHPEHAGAMLLKGYALAGLQQIETAADQIEAALAAGTTDRGAASALAVIELGRGNMAAAIDHFERAARLAPDAPDPRLALGQVRWATGRFAEAEAEFRKALALDPTHPLSNRVLGAFLVAARRPVEAEPYLRAWATTSGSPRASLVLADFYAAQARVADATAALEEAERGGGEAGVAAALRLASLEHANGQRREAHARLDALMARHSQHAGPRVLKAQFLLAEHRPEEALTFARQAVAQRPDVLGHYTVGLAQRALGNFPAATEAFSDALQLNPQATDVQTALAGMRLQTGRIDDAVTLAESAARARPADREARLLLVRSLIAKGDGPRATREAEALVAAHGAWAPAQTVHGLVALKSRALSAAEAAFTRALALDPGSLEALQGLVSVYVATGRPADGRQRLEQAARDRPGSADIHVLLAELAIAERRFDAAEAQFLRALELDAGHLTAYSRLAHLYAFQQRLDEAQAKYEGLIARHPQHVVAQTMVALMHQRAGRSVEARAGYERVLDLAPRSAVAANNLAWLLAEQGERLDHALQLAQTAARGLPDSVEVADTLGWVYLKRKLPTQAIPAFERAVQQEPQNPTYRYHLGLAYVAIGEWDKAREMLNAALAQPAFGDADRAREALAAIPPPASFR